MPHLEYSSKIGDARSKRILVSVAGCLMICIISLLMPDGALYAQSLESVMQNLSPDQRQALENLSPQERQALQAELINSGGKPTPELLQQLMANQAKKTQEQQAEVAPKAVSSQAMQKYRAEAEQAAKQLEAKTSINGLKRFGFDFFTPSRTRILALEAAISRGEVPQALQKDALAGFIGPLDMISSTVNASVAPQYALNPGDAVTVYYWGDLIELTTLKLTLDEQGVVSIPQTGRLVARGMTLLQFQNAVQNHLQRVFGKTIRLIATLDKLKSIQIFITGEAFRPGSYAVSAVTTLFNALYACGGTNENGSLRDVRLLRDNKTISLDFYDYLMNGDSKADALLQAGDTLFFSRTGKLASIAGEVGRPSVYELKDDEALKALVRMANGIKPSGLINKVHIQSLIPHKEKAVIDVDLSKNIPSADHELYDGDRVTIEPIIPEIRNMVTLAGAVKVPGIYELKKNMKVADLFNEINEPWGDAHLERVDVIRLDRDRRTTTAIPINLGKALKNDPEHNISLAPLDRVVVYSKWDVKYYPARIVTIQGAVTRPGDYPRTEGMRIKDLLLQAGGTLPGAENEVTISKARFFEEPRLISVKLDLLEAGDESQNLPLDDEDIVMVRSDSDFYIRPLWVEIRGEVQHPGTYPIMRKDYRLSELIEKAGGLSKMAHARGAVFMRRHENLPSPEQNGDLVLVDKVVNALNDIDARRLAMRNAVLLQMEAGVEATGKGPVVGAGTVLATGTSAKEAAALSLAPQIAQATGSLTGGIVSAFTPGGAITSQARTLADVHLAQSARIIIDLEKAIKGGSDNPANAVLMSGDTINIPRRTETVSVVGAVMNPVTVHIGAKRRVDDVVSRAGGYASDADEERTLLVRPDGSIMLAQEAKYVEEGDIVYVPTKVVATEILTTADKVINVIKYTLTTAAGVIVFLALIP